MPRSQRDSRRRRRSTSSQGSRDSSQDDNRRHSTSKRHRRSLEKSSSVLHSRKIDSGEDASNPRIGKEIEEDVDTHRSTKPIIWRENSKSRRSSSPKSQKKRQRDRSKSEESGKGNRKSVDRSSPKAHQRKLTTYDDTEYSDHGSPTPPRMLSHVNIPNKPPPVEKVRKERDILTTKTGGAYIPPAKLRLMQEQIADKSSAAYQRIAWEALKKSINGLVNKVNVANLGIIVRELMKENLVRGRGLFCRSVTQAQLSSPTFTHVYAGLIAVVNTKFPNIGELLLKRLVLQFRRGYKSNNKQVCMNSSRFIGHLVNQQVAHEILALEIVTLLLEKATDDSVETAIGFLKECGQKLDEVSPKGLRAVADRMRHVLHEGGVTARTQYLIESCFATIKDKFKDNPAVIQELDLVEDEDQYTHFISLDDEGLEAEDILNVFREDPDFLENEEKYKTLRSEILGESSSGESGSDASGEGSDEEEDEDEDDEEKTTTIVDNTETNLVALRRLIYLTIQSSLDFEECAHKLRKLNLKPGQEVELCHMILDCCAQQRTYEKFFGLLAQRFCQLNRIYVEPFQNMFGECYETCHRFDTNRLRHVAKLFAHLLFTDAISWGVLSQIRLDSEQTTSSKRIFIKILFQELVEYMGLQKLHNRVNDPTMQEAFKDLFPRDDPQATMFAINFFTSIGLGGLTEELRSHFKTMEKKPSKPVAPVAPLQASSSSSSSSSLSSMSSSSGDESSSKRRKSKKKPKKKKKTKKAKKDRKSKKSDDLSGEEDEHPPANLAETEGFHGRKGEYWEQVEQLRREMEQKSKDKYSDESKKDDRRSKRRHRSGSSDEEQKQPRRKSRREPSNDDFDDDRHRGFGGLAAVDPTLRNMDSRRRRQGRRESGSRDRIPNNGLRKRDEESDGRRLRSRSSPRREDPSPKRRQRSPLKDREQRRRSGSVEKVSTDSRRDRGRSVSKEHREPGDKRRLEDDRRRSRRDRHDSDAADRKKSDSVSDRKETRRRESELPPERRRRESEVSPGRRRRESGDAARDKHTSDASSDSDEHSRSRRSDVEKKKKKLSASPRRKPPRDEDRRPSPVAESRRRSRSPDVMQENQSRRTNRDRSPVNVDRRRQASPRVRSNRKDDISPKPAEEPRRRQRRSPSPDRRLSSRVVEPVRVPQDEKKRVSDEDQRRHSSVEQRRPARSSSSSSSSTSSSSSSSSSSSNEEKGDEKKDRVVSSSRERRPSPDERSAEKMKKKKEGEQRIDASDNSRRQRRRSVSAPSSPGRTSVEDVDVKPLLSGPRGRESDSQRHVVGRRRSPSSEKRTSSAAARSPLNSARSPSPKRIDEEEEERRSRRQRRGSREMAGERRNESDGRRREKSSELDRERPERGDRRRPSPDNRRRRPSPDNLRRRPSPDNHRRRPSHENLRRRPSPDNLRLRPSPDNRRRRGDRSPEPRSVERAERTRAEESKSSRAQERSRRSRSHDRRRVSPGDTRRSDRDEDHRRRDSRRRKSPDVEAERRQPRRDSRTRIDSSKSHRSRSTEGKMSTGGSKKPTVVCAPRMKTPVDTERGEKRKKKDADSSSSSSSDDSDSSSSSSSS